MAFKGREVLIQVDLSGTLTTVAAMRTRSITITNDQSDVTSDDDDGWKTLLSDTGARSITISGGAVFNEMASLEIFQDNAMTDTAVTMRVVFPDGTVIDGTFQIASFETGAEHLDAASASFSLIGSGPAISALAPAVLTEIFDFLTLGVLGRAVAITVDPSVATTFYALVLVSGNYRFAVSINSGSSWALTAGTTATTGNLVPQCQLIKTSDGFLIATNGASRIFQSPDDGVTFNSIPAVRPAGIAQVSPTRAIAGANDFPQGTYVLNSPYTSQSASSIPDSRLPVGIGVNGSTIVMIAGYIAGTDGVSFYRSINEGTTWVRQNLDFGVDLIQAGVEDIYAAVTYVDGIWYATITSDNQPYSFTYKSIDDGVTFTKEQSAHANFGAYRMTPFTARGNSLYAVGSDDAAANEAVLCNSTDQGATWTILERFAGSGDDVARDAMEVGGKLYIITAGSESKLYSYG